MFQKNDLTSLNVRYNLQLVSLIANDNDLITIGLSTNNKMTLLNVSNNNLISLINIVGLSSLEELYASNNRIMQIVTLNNQKLVKADLSNNRLNSWDLTNNTNLVDLNVSTNLLTSLDVSANTQLENLDVSYNSLTTLNVESNLELISLNTSYNDMITIGLSVNNKMTFLDVSNNELIEIVIVGLKALQELYANDNKIMKTVVTSLNTELVTAVLNNNRLTELDLDSNTKLKKLEVANNSLTSLDVSNNTLLTKLDASSNKLTYLDLYENTKLTTLNLLDNDFDNTVTTYVGDEVLVDTAVYLPEGNSFVGPTYTVSTDKVTVDDVGFVTSDTEQSFEVTTTYKNSSKETILEYVTTINFLELKSDVYEINYEKGYIYGKDTQFDTADEWLVVLKNISVPEEFDLSFIYDADNNQVKGINVLKGEEIIKSFYWINYVSELDLSKGYVYVADGEFDISTVSAVNATVKLEDNKINIYYNDDVLVDSIDVVSFETDYTIIDGEINVGFGRFSESSFKVVNGTVTTKDGNIIIKHGNDVVQTLKYYNYYFLNNKYISQDLNDEFIYAGTTEFDLDDIVVNNCTKSYENDLLSIACGDNEPQIWDVIWFETGYEVLKDSLGSGGTIDGIISVGTNEFSESEITVHGPSNVVSSGYREALNAFIINYDDRYYYSFEIVSYNVNSDDYDLTYDYIYLGLLGANTDASEIVLDSVEVENCTKSVNEENQLVVECPGHTYTWDVIWFTKKDNYTVTNNYLTGRDVINSRTKEFSLDDIDVYGENVKKELINDNLFVINYDNTMYWEFDVVSYYSDKYLIDDEYDYVYVENEEFSLDNINVTNCTKSINDSGQVVVDCGYNSHTWNIISLETDYIIDGGSINSGDVEFSVDNITVSGTNTSYTYENNTYTVLYDDYEVIKYSVNGYYSETYDLSNEYIYTGTDTFDIDKIITNGCTTDVEDNVLTIDCGSASRSWYLIRLETTYTVKDGYINTGTDEISTDSIRVQGNNVKLDVTDDVLSIIYDGSSIAQFDIISIYSDVYDLSNDFIYTGVSEFSLNYINVTESCTKEIKNNQLLVVCDSSPYSWNLIWLETDYEVGDDYISSGLNKFDASKVTVGGNSVEATYSDGIYSILFNEESILNIDVISYYSEVYKMTDEYLFVGFDAYDSKNITASNVELSEKNNRLVISRNGSEIDLIPIIKLSTNDDSISYSDDKLIIKDTLSSSDFISFIDVTNTSVNLKIFDTTDNESENVDDGYSLKVLYNDVELDTYSIELQEEYLIFDSDITVDEDNSYLKNLNLSTSVDDLVSNIDTNGVVTILDKNDNEISDSDLVGTGSKVKVQFTKNSYEYTIVVLGDTNGDGLCEAADFNMVRKHLQLVDSLVDVYFEAADTNQDDKIEVADFNMIRKYLQNEISGF